MTPVDARGRLDELPFTWRATKSGEILISWQGRLVTTVRAKAAERLLVKLDGASPNEAQHLLR